MKVLACDGPWEGLCRSLVSTLEVEETIPHGGAPVEVVWREAALLDAVEIADIGRLIEMLDRRYVAAPVDALRKERTAASAP